MDAATLHAIGPQTFERMLVALDAMLNKAVADAEARKFDFAVLLNARLAPDMFGLIGQVQMATDFAKNACSRLAGKEPPPFPDTETTLPELKARIARALDIVRATPAGALEGAGERSLTIRTGPDTQTTMTGAAYLTVFALTNFYFHVSMAYAILRHNGVPLGKRDVFGPMALPK
ncbi:MAG: DUF1993 family protein [Alphaproteobacteria bacterium]|nr:DUF1993 family protein [Alphaproteobacteria bacterium]